MFTYIFEESDESEKIEKYNYLSEHNKYTELLQRKEEK